MRGLYLHKTVRVLTHFKIFRLAGETINETKLFSYSFQHGKRERSLKNCVQLALILGNVNGVLFLSGCLMKMFIFVRCKSDKTTKPCNQIVLQHLGVFSKYLLFFLFFSFFFSHLHRCGGHLRDACLVERKQFILAVQLFKGVIDYKLMTK